MVQLKYQKAKRLKFSFLVLDAQRALGMRHFSFKVQNLSTFKVLNLRKENFNRLALWYLSCTVPRPKFANKGKNLFISLLVKWKYLRKT